jgi:hypothetical protein
MFRPFHPTWVSYLIILGEELKLWNSSLGLNLLYIVFYNTPSNTSSIKYIYLKTKLCGCSPHANNTDRATAACRRSRQPLRVEGVAWSAQRIPTVVNLGFLDRRRYFFIQVAPQLSSRGWVDPVLDPLLVRISGRSGNRTRNLWICSQKLWSLDHRGKYISADL